MFKPMGGGAFSYFPDLRIYGFPRPPDPFHETRSGLLYRKFTIWDLDPCMGREKLDFMFSKPAKWPNSGFGKSS